MIEALPDASSRGPDEPHMEWFQRTRGLGNSGIADRATRSQLIAEYMAADGTTLPAGVNITTRGKGETDPYIDSGDGKEEAENRRVEVIFCEPGKPPKEIPKKDKKPKPHDPEMDHTDVPPPKGPSTTLDIVAYCQHDKNRVAKAGGVLKVTGDAGTGDEITLTNTGSSSVKWSADKGAFSKTATNTAGFAAKPGVVKSFWLLNIDPEIYVLSGSSTAGDSQQITVHSYPLTEVTHSWAVDKNILDALKIATKIFNAGVRPFLGGELEWKVGVGELSLAGQWLEAAEPDKVEWAFKVNGKIVLFSAEVKFKLGSARLRNAVALVPGIGDYVAEVVDWLVKANAFFAIGGEVAVSAGYDSVKHSDATIATVTSTVSGKLGVEAGIAGGECVKVEADVGTSLIPSGGFKWDKKGIYVQMGVKFGGIKGAVTIKLAWGLLSYQESWTIVDESTLYPNEGSPEGAGKYYPSDLIGQ